MLSGALQAVRPLDPVAGVQDPAADREDRSAPPRADGQPVAGVAGLRPVEPGPAPLARGRRRGQANSARFVAHRANRTTPAGSRFHSSTVA